MHDFHLSVLKGGAKERMRATLLYRGKSHKCGNPFEAPRVSDRRELDIDKELLKCPGRLFVINCRIVLTR